MCLRKLGGILLLALAATAGIAQDHDERFPFDDVLHPKTISQADCLALPHTVWVAPQWQESGQLGRTVQRSAQGCIRYFPSAKVEGAQTAVFFIHGDAMGLEGRPDQNREAYEKTGSYKAQLAVAERTARDIGLPVIRIGRPGVLGSTGMSHVRERRLPMEAHLINAAISAIKEHFGYRRIQLAGLSGGGGLVGAALTLGRIDVDCAVVGSGAVSMKTRARLLGSKQALSGRDQTGQLLSDIYDPIDHVGGVRPDSQRRIFVLGDPLDRSVAFESQIEFHQRLASAGIPVSLLTTQAKDAMHHRVAPEAQRVAAWCLAGMPDSDIQRRLKADS